MVVFTLVRLNFSAFCLTIPVRRRPADNIYYTLWMIRSHNKTIIYEFHINNKYFENIFFIVKISIKNIYLNIYSAQGVRTRSPPLGGVTGFHVKSQTIKKWLWNHDCSKCTRCSVIGMKKSWVKTKIDLVFNFLYVRSYPFFFFMS